MSVPLDGIKRLLPGGRFTRGVAVLVGGTALAQCVGILVLPILTRLYAPHEFGLLRVYAAIFGIFASVATLRYVSAIPLPKQEEDAADVLALSVRTAILLACLSVLGIWLLGGRIARAVDAPAIEAYLWLVPFGLLCSGALQAFNYWAVRRGAFRRVSAGKVVQVTGQALAQIGLGIGKLGALGLMLGQLVGLASGAAAVAVPALVGERSVLGKTTLSGAWRMAARYRRFPMLSSSAALLNAAGLGVPALLLASLYGLEVAGWFALSQRVLGMPMTLIGQSVSQVYVAEGARLRREAPEELRPLFWRVVKGQFLMALPFVVCIALPAPWLFPAVFGSRWAEAGVFVQALSALFVLQFVAGPLGGTLDVVERQDLHLAREIVRLVVVSGAVLAAGLTGQTPLAAIISFSAAGSASYLFCGALAWHAVRRFGVSGDT